MVAATPALPAAVGHHRRLATAARGLNYVTCHHLAEPPEEHLRLVELETAVLADVEAYGRCPLADKVC